VKTWFQYLFSYDEYATCYRYTTAKRSVAGTPSSLAPGSFAMGQMGEKPSARNVPLGTGHPAAVVIGRDVTRVVTRVVRGCQELSGVVTGCHGFSLPGCIRYSRVSLDWLHGPSYRLSSIECVF
jgi:hypothetical protein